MTYLRTQEKVSSKRDGTPKKVLKKVLFLRCDTCLSEFSRGFAQGIIAKTFHFCSKQCSQKSRSKNGILRPQIEARLAELFGKDFRKVMANAMQDCDKVARKEKTQKTMMERYGVHAFTCFKFVHEAGILAAALPESIEKRKNTTLQRFSVETVLSLPEVHVLGQTEEVYEQRFETMKQNGTMWTSHPENEFFKFLCEKFGEHDVERWKRVFRWPIDFYVKSIETYFQLDGEFWHGLDRPFEEIQNSGRKIDKAILHKIKIDCEQNAWFAANNLKLIRITDKQFEEGNYQYV